MVGFSKAKEPPSVAAEGMVAVEYRLLWMDVSTIVVPMWRLI